jgi:hypothetical protein
MDSQNGGVQTRWLLTATLITNNHQQPHKQETRNNRNCITG